MNPSSISASCVALPLLSSPSLAFPTNHVLPSLQTRRLPPPTNLGSPLPPNPVRLDVRPQLLARSRRPPHPRLESPKLRQAFPKSRLRQRPPPHRPHRRLRHSSLSPPRLPTRLLHVLPRRHSQR